MLNGVVETLRDILRDLVRDLRAETEALSAAELDWRPRPTANSIGITVWHVARWLDVLECPVLEGRDAAAERWQLDGWAARRGYDPRGIGAHGLGTVTGYGPEEVARIPSLTAPELVTHLDAAGRDLDATLHALDAAALAAAARGGAGERTAYDWIKAVLEGALGHLGEVRALRAMQQAE